MDATGTAKPIDIGADGIGSDGKKVGTVSYVVVPPAEMRITDIVVRTGGILYREAVVPVPVIGDVENGKVCLSIDKDGLQKYPESIEVDYRRPPAVWVPPEGVASPPTGILWPAGAYEPAAAGVRVN